MNRVLDDFSLKPNLSFPDKVRIQSQALAPVTRALGSE
jgi:hypothetical protein